MRRFLVGMMVASVMMPLTLFAETAGTRFEDIVANGPWVDARYHGLSAAGADIENRKALQAALDTGKHVLIPPGTYQVAPGISQNKSRQFVFGHGVDFIVTTPGDFWILGTGGKKNILRDVGIVGPTVRYKGPVGTSRSVGFKLVQVQESSIEVGADNFGVGLLLTADSEGTVYNEIHPKKIWNCGIGISLVPVGEGWVNENNFYGGRFGNSGKDAGTKAHVFSPKSSGKYGAPNHNKYYGLSLEGTAEYAILDGGVSNLYISPRLEGQWTADGNSVYLTPDSQMVFLYSAWYATRIKDEGKKNSYWAPGEFRFPSHSVKDRTIAEFGRSAPNNGNVPAFVISDEYKDSGSGQALEVRLSRNWQKEDYFVRGTKTESGEEKFRITGNGEGSFKGGVSIGDGGGKVNRILQANLKWAPGPVPDNQAVEIKVPVDLATTGNPVMVGLSSVGEATVLLAGRVSASKQVTVTLLNRSGKTINIPQGNLTVYVFQP